MEEKPQSRNDLTAAAIVALVIADIHDSDHADRNELLAAFLRVGWSSGRAQSQ
jgi:hypothetical protein